MKKSIGIVGAGDMGSAVATALARNDYRVFTCLAGRSERTRQLAAASGMRDYAALDDLAASVDTVLSILPPAAAEEFAKRICPAIKRSGRDVLFADCNAVSPSSVRTIGEIAAQHGVAFVDASLVGAPPRPDRSPVYFYVSGPRAASLDALANDLVDVRNLGDEIGRASALKMVFASLTKGTNALRVAALMAGERLGVGPEVRKAWAEKTPAAWQTMAERIPDLAADAARWSPEMREIAETYASVGMTPEFHLGAEWLFELLAETPLAAESREEARASGRDLEATLEIFAAALDVGENAT